MKMRETSRAVDKKLRVNNELEYQIETLHKYGEEHPETGLHNKVVRRQFKESIEVPDPVKKTTIKQPMKPFMVSQLQRAFEQGRIILSPFDEVLHKQLVDYEIERISQNGDPIFTSKNEHFIDALGLAYLAFVLEFPDLTKGIETIKNTSKMAFNTRGFQGSLAQRELMDISLRQVNNPWAKDKEHNDPRELKGDKPTYYKVPNGTPLGFYKSGQGNFGWGSRAGRSISGSTRRLW